MSARTLTGTARVLGDDINTDYLISSRRKKESLDPQVLRRYLLEDIDPAFAQSVMDGDILVAGQNFGCGSAMEVAVTAVLGAGIGAVVAKSYARSYWRNAVNNGLLVLIADTGGIAEGDALQVRLDRPTPELCVISQASRCIVCEPMPEFMLAMREAGGLAPYLRLHGKLA
jgi:3-isopropylmalate/(R)-2-methylmalate dehydratase small subunit